MYIQTQSNWPGWGHLTLKGVTWRPLYLSMTLGQKRQILQYNNGRSDCLKSVVIMQ